jgi:hypothetical protein
MELVMPKSRGRNRPPQLRSAPPAPPPSAGMPQFVLGYDPTGPAKQKDIVEVKNAWSEYTLDDGSVIRTKGVLVDAKRMLDQFNANGDPIYLLQLSVVHELVAPNHLKKPKPGPEKTEAERKIK